MHASKQFAFASIIGIHDKKFQNWNEVWIEIIIIFIIIIFIFSITSSLSS